MPAVLTKPKPSTRSRVPHVAAKPAFKPLANISHWFLQRILITDEFQLSLRFEDGFITELDFSPWLAKRDAGPLRKPLRDLRHFSQVYLDHGVLTWPNGYDLAPETVRAWAELGYCD